MKIPSIYTRSATRPDVAMTPMIDVVFLLLVFFLWTSSFQIPEQKLPSYLSPELTAGVSELESLQLEDFERIVVRITAAEGRIRWILNNNHLSGFPQLQERLAQVAAIRADLPLVIDPEDSVVLARVLDVYDLARQLGWSDIQFAAKRISP